MVSYILALKFTIKGLSNLFKFPKPQSEVTPKVGLFRGLCTIKQTVCKPKKIYIRNCTLT